MYTILNETMAPAEWIAAAAALGGFAGWMTALWIRVGRILQRLDDVSANTGALDRQVNEHEARITRLEVFAEE
jgi:hypothetical protein